MALGLLFIGACLAPIVVLSIDRETTGVDLSLGWYGTTPAVMLHLMAWDACMITNHVVAAGQMSVDPLSACYAVPPDGCVPLESSASLEDIQKLGFWIGMLNRPFSGSRTCACSSGKEVYSLCSSVIPGVSDLLKA